MKVLHCVCTTITTMDIRQTLADKGWAAVPLLTEGECDSFTDALWSWAERIFGVKRDEPSTWKHWPYTIRGLLQHYELGHQDFIWALRQHPSLLRIFRDLYGTDDLLVSFDGVCFVKPTHRLRENGSAHTDSPRTLSEGVDGFQSMILMTPASRASGTLKFWEGSHMHADLTSSAALLGDNDAVIRDIEAMGCPGIEVDAPKGHVLVWDSRVLHQGIIPQPNQQRVTAYVAFQPRRVASETDLAKKRRLYSEYRMTGHAAGFGIKPFAKSARHMKPLTIQLSSFRTRDAIESPEVLRLAGF